LNKRTTSSFTIFSVGVLHGMRCALQHSQLLLCVLCTMCTKQSRVGLLMSVHLFVHMIQLENRWTHFDKFWYGCLAICSHPFFVFFNFPQSIIPTWRTDLRGWSDLQPLNIGSYSDLWKEIKEK
jgi:hypothetical protein